MSAEGYWVYTNPRAADRGAVIHRGDCSECQHGQGKRERTGPKSNQWHGPFPTLQDAWHRAYGLSQVAEPRECAHCIALMGTVCGAATASAPRWRYAASR